MLRVVLMIFSLITFSSGYCQGINHPVLQFADLDGDATVDTISYNINAPFVSGYVKTSTTTRFFKFENDGFTSALTSIGERKLVYNYGGTGSGRVENFEVYDYDQKINNWVLTKSIIIYHDTFPLVDGSEIDFSYYIQPFETIDHQNVMFKIVPPAVELLKSLISKATDGDTWMVLNVIEYLYNFPISSSNVDDYVILGKNLGDDIGLNIMRKIYEQFPDNSANLLNMADLYYNVDNNSMAKEFYRKFVKKSNNIPRYVFARTK